MICLQFQLCFMLQKWKEEKKTLFVNCLFGKGCANSHTATTAISSMEFGSLQTINIYFVFKHSPDNRSIFRLTHFFAFWISINPFGCDDLKSISQMNGDSINRINFVNLSLDAKRWWVFVRKTVSNFRQTKIILVNNWIEFRKKRKKKTKQTKCIGRTGEA